MELKINVDFEEQKDFLKCFNELYKNGFQVYLDINKFALSLSIDLDIRTQTHKEDILKIVKKCNPSYLVVNKIIKKYEKEVLINKK